MDNISFQSRIRPVGICDFYAAARSIGERGNVKNPWTLDESILNDSAFTSGIIDCTVCGITDGTKVLMTHICPTVKENYNFKRIAEFIKSKLAFMNNEYLQGFLLGSQGEEIRSRTLFDNFSKLLEELRIPTSKFRAGDAETHVAYSSIKDEWIISSKDVPAWKKEYSNKETLKNMFEEVEISELDEIVEG